MSLPDTGPVQMAIMDPREFIRAQQLSPVTSAFIRESSSEEFHRDGLFSEKIFGQIGSPERLTRFSYISLNSRIIHPIVWNSINRLKALYGEVLAGKSYAIFDNTTKDLERADDNTPDAGTGFNFFLKHLPNIEFRRTESLNRNDKITQIENYKDRWFIRECIVAPAGIRDMEAGEANPKSGSVNGLYASLLNYTKALPPIGGENTLYDSLRFAIQKKVNEIHMYFFNEMLEGKYGYFQRKYGSRSLALGTRNVISSAAIIGDSPDDPQFIKIDEVKLPIFQATKMCMPLMVYNLRELFFNEIFSQAADQASLIDPKTLALQYHPITEDEKQRFLSSEGIEKLTNLFRDPEFRTQPVVAYDDKDNVYFLYMVYDLGDVVYYTRSVVELKNSILGKHGKFDMSKLRPLTYIEMFYIAVFRATLNTPSYTTRYPAIGVGSDVPGKTHIVSTMPSRIVQLINQNNMETTIELPEYPILGNQNVDSTQLHPSILDGRMGLGGDYDGDTISESMVLSEEAKAEGMQHLDSLKRYMHPTGQFYTCRDDLIKLTFYNLTRAPE